MSHFILHLPSGETADVRSGWIIKKSFRLPIFRTRRSFEKKKGYIIKMLQGGEEYCLLRSLDGEWLSEGIPGFALLADSPFSQILKEAILTHER